MNATHGALRGTTSAPNTVGGLRRVTVLLDCLAPGDMDPDDFGELFLRAVERAPDVTIAGSGELWLRDLVSIGDRIRSLRTAEKVSQSALAAMIGVGAPHLSKVESGQERPSAAMLWAIERALGRNLLDADVTS